MSRLMPYGYRVYVENTTKETLDDVVRVALRIRSLGITASTQIVASRVL